MYKYRIYGLNVSSDLQLDCFAGDFDTADIAIRFTKSEAEAESLAHAYTESEPFVVRPNDCSGRIYICGQENIIVYYESDYDLKCALIHYLLGYAFSYILLQKRIFFLHGSCVVLNNSATVIVGNCGTGKSTLAAGMAKYGARMLSDDMTRLELNTEIPFVYPSYPTHRLWKNTIENLGMDMSGATEIIGVNEKFMLTDDNRHIFMDRNVPINAIVFLRPSDQISDVRLVRENIRHSMRIINNNVYNNSLIIGTELTSDYFDYILSVCDKIPIYSLQRPQNSFMIKEQVSIILREIYNEART